MGDSGCSLGQEDLQEKGMATCSIFLPGESRGQRSLAGWATVVLGIYIYILLDQPAHMAESDMWSQSDPLTCLQGWQLTYLTQSSSYILSTEDHILGRKKHPFWKTYSRIFHCLRTLEILCLKMLKKNKTTKEINAQKAFLMGYEA